MNSDSLQGVAAELSRLADRLAQVVGNTDWRVGGKGTLEALAQLRLCVDRLETCYGKGAKQAAMAGVHQRAGYPSMEVGLYAKVGTPYGQTRRQLAAAAKLAGNPVVEAASLAGEVNSSQAVRAANAASLAKHQLPPEAHAQAEELAVKYATRGSQTSPAQLAETVLALLAPQLPPSVPDPTAAEQQALRAHRLRYVTFAPDGAGSMRFSGQLPLLEGEAFKALVSAYAERTRAARKQAADAPYSLKNIQNDTYTPWSALLADGLVAMVENLSSSGIAPNYGGDRPRLNITLSFDQLKAAVIDAQPVQLKEFGDEVLSASQVRRLACDCEVLPAVLNGESQVLDIGRASRVTPRSARRAVELRDEGCCFPGCAEPAARTQMHHLVPWIKGGPTVVGGLAAFCSHHHGVVEPVYIQASNGEMVEDPEQWVAKMGPNGYPVVLPPQSLDPDRKPMLHERLERKLNAQQHRNRASGQGSSPPADGVLITGPRTDRVLGNA
ncbi:MAG: HNH endonuclease, partial [Bifidobacteriaceae bacterium]|nr:HNH endonuclease [Bifidobacteriaceae bacterium]